MDSALIGRLMGDNILSKIAIGKTINFANLTLFLFAYIFGKTSPKSKIKKVTKITSTENFKIGLTMFSNKFFPMKENKITTPILIKLLATKSVASNFFGRSSKRFKILTFSGLFRYASSKSFCDNEKKATSAPETIAVQNSKAKIPINPNIKLISKFSKNAILGGSLSKLWVIS